MILYEVAAGLVMPAFLLLMLLVALYIVRLHGFFARLRQFEPAAWNELGRPELFTYTPLASLRIGRLLAGDGGAIRDRRAAQAARFLLLLHRLLAGAVAVLLLLELLVNLGRR
ncbi:MAG TPA: hypothetical protein VFA75_11735 [Nevskia sp.]|nr:hypothetical protein [Nevskia sp.]